METTSNKPNPQHPHTNFEAEHLLYELRCRQIALQEENEALLAAQQELRATLERCADNYDYAPVGCFIVARDGAIQHANRAGATMLGLASSKFKHSNLYTFVSETSLATFNAMLVSVFSSEAEQTCDVEFQLADGRGSVFTQISAVVDAPSATCRLVAMDITARKHAEEELRDTEQRWRLALQGAGEGVWVWEIAVGTVTYSPRCTQLLGYNEGELGADADEWTKRVHPDELPELQRKLQAYFSGETEIYASEHRMLCKNGRWKWVLDRGMVTQRDAANKPLRMIGTQSDISDRKHAEELLRIAEERWSFALEGARDGVWDWSIATDEFFLSARAREMLGITEKELEWDINTWKKRIFSEDLSGKMDALQAHMAGKTSLYVHEHRIVAESGVFKWILARGMIVSRDTDGKPLRMIGTISDITDRKLADEQLTVANLVYLASAEGMMVVDAENHIIAINPAFSAITGYSPEEAIGKRADILCPDSDQGRARHYSVWDAISVTGHWQGELWGKTRSGSIFAQWLTVNSTFNADGSAHRRVALFSDITEKKKAEELIWQHANFDPLTNLPNRRMLHDRLEQDIKKAKREESPLALLFIDLDHFKEINDTLGHEVGDKLLIEVARRIGDCVRETDTVARLGGDEFTVILSDILDLRNIDRIAQNILSSLTIPFRLADEKVFVSASIGVTIYPDNARRIEDLFKQADQALYASKNSGRNQYCYFTPMLQKAADARRLLCNDLRDALKGNQLVMMYQPIVELATGNIHKAEALIRWRHPVRGLIGPTEFIPLAEATGLIDEIGDWVFKESANMQCRWADLYQPTFKISVNMSPAQFRHANKSAAYWMNFLRSFNLGDRGMVIEITEGLLLDATPEVSRVLLALRQAGIQISLDDFGTGYSSLAYLKKFNIDYLKIDQSFVRDLDSDDSNRVLCEAIIGMAKKLGLRTIAEGVEAQTQRDFLVAAGCDYAQGFLFSPAVSAEQFENLLTA